MTPTEKAIELINKFIPNARYFEDGNKFSENAENAKQCALICVEEILNNFGLYKKEKSYSSYSANSYKIFYPTIEFYEEVKQEIEQS